MHIENISEIYFPSGMMTFTIQDGGCSISFGFCMTIIEISVINNQQGVDRRNEHSNKNYLSGF